TELSGQANLLVMPSLDAANITYNALKELTDGESVGPMLLGLRRPAHILQESVSTRGILDMTAVAVVDAQINGATELPFDK
ncbi:MAG: phosphate acyltransferase, partial [Rhodospirillales bacterium]|nr:phosphate acyltransferase [Rhodospirillales bacterium]